MLTLERKESEVITITHNDESIDIIVTKAKNGRVKLTFNGAINFEIQRKEIVE